MLRSTTYSIMRWQCTTKFLLPTLMTKLGFMFSNHNGKNNRPLFCSPYKSPTLTADAIVLDMGCIPEDFGLLMVTRRNDPFKDMLALPGGFVDYGESPKTACFRELREETNLVGKSAEIFQVRGNPDRVTDGYDEHIVSLVYLVSDIQNVDELQHGDDAKWAEFYNIGDLLAEPEKLAFDHADIIQTLYTQIIQVHNFAKYQEI